MADTSGTIGSGGDYSSVNDWETSISVATDPSIGSMLSGYEETTAVTISGYTPTASNYIELTADDGAEHDGRADEVSSADNARIVVSGANDVVRIFDPNVRISWLEIHGPGNNANKCISVGFTGAGDVLIHHNVIHNNQDNSGANDGIFPQDVTTVFMIYRNIVYGCGRGGITLDSEGSGSECFNNTLYENNHEDNAFLGGFIGNDNDSLIKYNASYDNNVNDFDENNGTYDWNTSSDTSASGSNSNNSETATDDLVDPTLTFTSTDLLIKSGSSLIDDSETVSTTGRPQIDESIDNRGVSITGTWDKGASQFVSAGGGATNSYYYQRNQ